MRHRPKRQVSTQPTKDHSCEFPSFDLDLTNLENKVKDKNFLLIGYGNPGRLDDGLGPVLAERIAAMNLDGLDVEIDYQLNIEHAEQLKDYKVVIFVDADTAGAGPFWVKKIGPQADHVVYTSHAMKPESVLAVGRDLFDAQTEAFLVGIRGYDFNEYEEKLSLLAQKNLDKALAYVVESVNNGRIEELNPDDAPASEI